MSGVEKVFSVIALCIFKIHIPLGGFAIFLCLSENAYGVSTECVDAVANFNREQHSPMSWTEYSDQLGVRVKRDMVWPQNPKIEAELYLLGFRPTESGVSSPTISEFAKNYLAIQKSRGESDPIMPGRAFNSVGGKFRMIGSSERPEADWVEIEPGSLSPSQITKMIKARLFPLSIKRGVHDLGHFLGFLADRGYAEGILGMFEVFGGKGPRPALQDMKVRGAYILEMLSLVKTSRRSELLSLMSAPIKANSAATVTMDKLFNHYATMSDQAIGERAFAMQTIAKNFLTHLGGAAADKALMNRMPYADKEFSLTGEQLVHDLFESTNEITIAKVTGESIKLSEQARFELIAALSRLECFLWNSSAVSSKDALLELTKPKPDKNSPIYQMFVTSGMSTDYQNARMQEHPQLMHDTLTLKVPEDFESSFE